jgi:CRISPR-associated protein Csb2
MTVLAYRFLAGRYHATPWGAHVNEGLVEWPPSPFRLLRALVATGFSRFGWTAIEGAAKELFELLASVPPSYSLPDGTASHTRHYMPPFKGNTTKVIDAFLRFPANSTLHVRYGTSLPDPSKALLAALLRAQPYLGRAEAWVEGELLERAPEGLVWIEPATQPPGPGFERVELLASEDAKTFAGWRETFISREVERREREERAKAAAKGKVFKALAKSEREKLEERVPRDVVLALLQDTGDLRKEGWSQPPGTRWVGYFRPSEALVPRVVTPPRRDHDERPTVALLALSSDTSKVDVFPPMTDAVRRLEALHDALVRLSDSPNGPSPCFTGRLNGESLRGHRHAALVPLALGTRKDRLDHILVHCPMGFDDGARQALFRIRKTWAHDLPDLFVTLAGMGTLDAFAKSVPLVRASRIFRSATPFVPSRFLRTNGNSSLREQVQRELEFRSLPRAREVDIEFDENRWVSTESVTAGRRASDLAVDVDGAPRRPHPRFRHFLRARAERPPPVGFGLSLRLVLEEPVSGPVTLGYGSHFGLGVFEPAEPM